MSLKVCKEQCDQCLFSKNRIVKRFKEIVTGCQNKDTHFECHKGTIKGENIVCAGFYNRFTSQMIRIAGRLGMIEFVNPHH